MSEELRSSLESAATNNSRSLNNEIIQRLEASMNVRDFRFPTGPKAIFPAVIAREYYQESRGIGLSEMLCEQINEKIMTACIAGRNTVKLNLKEALGDLVITNEELEAVLTIVENTFVFEGYKITISDDEISVDF